MNGCEATYPSPDELAADRAWSRMNRAINWAEQQLRWERRAASRHRVYQAPDTAASLAQAEDATARAWGKAFDAAHQYESPTT